jgi:hypothetical protein
MPPVAPPLASPAVAAQEFEQQAVIWLAISLGSSLFCVSLCLGIIGAIFCYLAIKSAKQGLLADAEEKLKWGKIVTLVGSVLGIFSTTLALIFR